MKIYIPTVGDQFTVTAPWELTLIYNANVEFVEFLNEQNPGLIEGIKKDTWSYDWQYEKNASGQVDMSRPKSTTVVFPANMVIQLASLDIKITTRYLRGPSRNGPGASLKIMSGLDGTKKKFPLWVRLDDLNKLLCEPVTIKKPGASLKRLKKPEILKMLGDACITIQSTQPAQFNFNSYAKRPDWMMPSIEGEILRLADWFSKMTVGSDYLRGHNFNRLYCGDSTFERSGLDNKICTRRFTGQLYSFGWQPDRSVDASKTVMVVVTDDDTKITDVRFEGI